MAVRAEEPAAVGRAQSRGPTRYRAAIPFGLALAAYALAFLQRPGLDTSDTKINLHVSPGRFLSTVAQVWSPTAGLGHVQGGQYAGYLWPMGPFFSLGHAIGLPDWVTERLWLGTLLALAALGVIRLLDALLDRRRGTAHLIAGAAYMLNPYVVVMTSRTSVSLVAYAALPWLLLAVHRGVREPGRWWWPAALALITTSTAGGVNATVSGFVLLGPILLLLYEVLIGRASLRSAVGFGWRAAAATALASMWWVVPLLVQSHYGLNFLPFTEQVGSIWSPTSLTESLRLMGYWPTYLGVGFGDRLIPYFGNATTMLFDPAVVLATLLVPGLTLAGYRWTRRWRYGPFFLLTALVALLLMTVSWPSGTPGRRAATFVFDHVTALDFLRTTYKAAPLLALAVAVLAGVGLRAAGRRWPRWAPAVAGGALALVAVSALPFLQGRAIELTWKRIPTAWRQAGRDLSRALPQNSRAMVLPGQAYAYYGWGGTVDPILPALTSRPVAIRNVPPFDDLHAVDLLWTVDDLVQQQRLLPGQLAPLLNLMSVRSVLSGTDDNTALSGAVAPAAAARELATQPGFTWPTRSYGPVRRFPAAAETAEPPVSLPEVRRYDVPAPGLVRVEPRAPASVVDGSADGVADLAALGALPRSRPLLYAGDLSAAALRQQASSGAQVFITDSNRRRVFVASRMLQNVGATEPADQPFAADASVIDPFPGRGSAAQTVAGFEGARYVTAPYEAQLAQFPEHAAFAAFDGDPSTSWYADPTLPPSQQWIEIGLARARDVPYLDLLPDHSSPLVVLTQVAVNGRRYRLRAGWNRLPVALRHVRRVRVAITHVNIHGHSTAANVGLAEVRIPGVRVRELLRTPLLAERALRGADLRHVPISYVFERTTAAAPLQRGPASPQGAVRGDRLQQEAALIRQAQDPETGIARSIDPPAARSWAVSGLATVSPTAPDPALDRLAGTVTHGATFSSSGRLAGLPGDRASSAFDGSAATAWVAPLAAAGQAWIAWHTPAPRVVRRLALVRSGLSARFPTLISLAPTGGSPVTLPVAGDGTVRLPVPLRARGFRLTVLRSAGAGAVAVAVAEIRGTGVAVVRTGRGVLAGRCGDLTARLGFRAVALRASGTVANLDAGRPLELSPCGAPVALPAGPADVTVAPGLVRPLIVQLRSPAPQPLAVAAAAGGALLAAGHQGATSYTGIRLQVNQPSWLVLGQSYNRGWKAGCDGRSLGPPRVIDGFANGWPVGPGCRNVTIRFGPQTEVDVGYAIGAAACLALLLILLLRRPHAAELEPAWAASGRMATAPWTAGRAVAAGLLAAAGFGVAFGLRAGVVVGPAFALILWRGIASRRLLWGAGLLLVAVVPLLYLLFEGHDQGGYDIGYASQHLGAHWVAVAAYALLTLVLLRDLSRASARLRGRAPPA